MNMLMFGKNPSTILLLVAATLAALACAADPTPNHMHIFTAAEAAASGARCLDGSPSGFFHSPGAGANANKVVIWLEGGGLCQHYEDCAKRATTALGSSTKWTVGFRAQLMSGDPLANPDFHDWVRVYIPYCSGDLHSGRMRNRTNPWSTTAQTSNDVQHSQRAVRMFGLAAPTEDGSPFTSGNSDGFYFAGHNTIEAVLNTLDSLYNITDAATDALLTGCSAGGMGTFYHADWLAARLPNAKRVRANPQAGWFGAPYFENYANYTAGEPPQPSGGYAHNVSGWLSKIDPFLHEKCAAHAREAGTRALECAIVPLLYANWIETPMFVSENVADSYQIYVSGGAPLPESKATPAVERYVAFVQGVLRSSLNKTVTQGRKRERDGLFAPACLCHCLAFSGPGAPTVEGVTHAAALGDWYFGRGEGNTMWLAPMADFKTLLSCPASHVCR
jgi:O-palmitoleoyl-L-serine hydrolase